MWSWTNQLLWGFSLGWWCSEGVRIAVSVVQLPSTEPSFSPCWLCNLRQFTFFSEPQFPHQQGRGTPVPLSGAAVRAQRVLALCWVLCREM
jgi:hypothetical protein